MIHKTFYAAVSFLFICNLLHAQPFNLKKEINPTELKLIDFNPKSDANKKGRINFTKVVQIKDTAYYFVKKTSIYSPIVVSIGVGDPLNPVQVSLHKWNWKVASRPGKKTNEKGYWEERFSTEGDFGIMVVATQKPTAYNIYVWVGEEAKFDVTSPFTTYKAKKKNLFNIKNILMGLGILLAIAALWFFIKRKKTGKLVVIISALLTTSFPSFAQLDGLFDGISSSSEGSLPLNPNDFSSGTIVQNQLSPSSEPSTDLSGELEGPDPYNPNTLSSRLARHSETINNVSTAITTGANIISSGADLWEAFNVLDAGECTPDFSQPANAMIPSSCPGNSGCNDCYKSALDGFNADRQTLARMMCLFMNTKNFTDKAIAFGNSMASIPGGVGMGWIPAKRKIDQGFTTFKSTYDRKARELLASLQKNMMKIDQCENAFGQQDWYQRFGFMYFEFMQQKYKRPD